MDLSGIISIAGKPGLYSVVAQSSSNIIVENLETGRRMPAFASNKISALEDITMYTTDEDMPLPQIVQNIWDKEEGKKALSHKEDVVKLRKYLDEIIPGCDHEKIYDSDVKKLFQWYNLMVVSGILEKKIKEEAEKEKETEKEGSAKSAKKDTSKTAKEDKSIDSKTSTSKKQTAAKKSTTSKSTTAKSGAKAAPKKSASKPQSKAKSTTARTSSKSK